MLTTVPVPGCMDSTSALRSDPSPHGNDSTFAPFLKKKGIPKYVFQFLWELVALLLNVKFQICFFKKMSKRKCAFSRTPATTTCFSSSPERNCGGVSPPPSPSPPPVVIQQLRSNTLIIQTRKKGRKNLFLS